MNEYGAILSAGQRLLSCGEAVAAFHLLWGCALDQHARGGFSQAATALANIENVAMAEIDPEVAGLLWRTIAGERERFLPYSQYFGLASIFAARSQNLEWACDLARQRVRLSARYSGKEHLLPAIDPASPGRTPDFIIAGFMKTGTTSLFDFLASQPTILPGASKEIGFWTNHHLQELGLSWYRACFPSQDDQTERTIVGEGYPAYVSHPAAIDRIAGSGLPIKFVITLRDPVARTLSHIRHNIRYGIEARDTNRYLDFYLPIYENSESLTDAMNREPKAAISTSMYCVHISRLLSRFPRNRILILETNELSNASQIIPTLSSFLECDLESSHSMPTANVGVDESESGADPQLVNRLRCVLDRGNRELSAVVGRSFSWNS